MRRAIQPGLLSGRLCCTTRPVKRGHVQLNHVQPLFLDDESSGHHRALFRAARGQWGAVTRSQSRRAKLFSPSAAYRVSRHFSYWAARAL